MASKVEIRDDRMLVRDGQPLFVLQGRHLPVGATLADLAEAGFNCFRYSLERRRDPGQGAGRPEIPVRREQHVRPGRGDLEGVRGCHLSPSASPEFSCTRYILV